MERSGIVYADSSLVYMMVCDATHIGMKNDTEYVSIWRIDPYYAHHARLSYTKGYIGLITYQLRSDI